MSSEVDICNLAIGNIFGKSITDLDSRTKESLECKLRYPIARDAVMEDFPWSFSSRVEPLSLLSETPKQWSYMYAYPKEFARINYLVDQSIGDSEGLVREYYTQALRRPAGNRSFSIGRSSAGDKVILTNVEDACAHATFYEERATRFSAQFVEALSHKLASSIAVPIAGVKSGRQLRDDELRMYLGKMASLWANELNESERDELPDSEFITGRI